MFTSENNGTDIGLSFLAGAMLGAGVALLFAPRRGSETREYLGRKMREGGEVAKRTVEKGRQAVTSAVRQVERRNGEGAELPAEA